MKSKYTYYYMLFSITLPLEAIYDMSGQGDQTETVAYWKNRIKNKPDSRLIKQELKEYGAWDKIELEDDEKNWERILWITACNIKEDDEFKNDMDANEND